jgi:hypothetical protein
VIAKYLSPQTIQKKKQEKKKKNEATFTFEK